MNKEQDYFRDLAEIRSMMERSSKFLSLSGLAGIMAGIYALVGAYMAYKIFDFNPVEMASGTGQPEALSPNLPDIITLAIGVLALAFGTAFFLSHKRAAARGEKVWNPTSRRLLAHMAVPFLTGGILILILVSKGLTGLAAPLSLLFYGLALYNASRFTYGEVRILGIVQMALGLAGSYFVEYGLLCWAVGFGGVHIVYGVYMHFRYER